jgi:putative phosphoribosyl transferase
MSLFVDRSDAGRKLAEKLQEFSRRENGLVLALSRGGVPVAYEVALSLRLELDVFVVRKLRLPDREDLAVGVIASGGVRVLDERIVRELGIADSVIASVAAQEQRELQRQEKLYRPDKTDHRLEGRTVIVVDDGMATGTSLRAALAAIKSKNPLEVVAAIPVAEEVVCRSFQGIADRLVTVACVDDIGDIGRWYASFEQVTDEQVQDLLLRRGPTGGKA